MNTLNAQEHPAEHPAEVLTPRQTVSQAAQVTPSGAGYRVLGLAMIGLGVLGMRAGDFAPIWQRIPIEHLPGRPILAYACALLEIACGLGLLFRRTAAMAARVLLVFVLSWAVLLKLPAVVAVPLLEGTWLGLAEITVILAGAWTAWLALAGVTPSHRLLGLGGARTLFALSLLPIGLSHFFYLQQTAAYVPSWLHWQTGWAGLTGAANIAAGLAVLTGLWSRLAATLEAAMLTLITLLVWTPGLTPDANGLVFQTTAFLISTSIAAGAWVVADAYRGTPWLAMKAPRAA